jgi:hypothetical protein
MDTLSRIDVLLDVFCLIVYADAIVDIAPQLMTLIQRTKSNRYHKNKYSSV